MKKKANLFLILTVICVGLFFSMIILGVFVLPLVIAVILGVIFLILAVVCFLYAGKIAIEIVENKKKEEEKILSENDIEQYPISIEFKRRYGLSFTEFRNLIREQVEQFAKQKQNKDHKNAVILVLEDNLKGEFHFHELKLKGKQYFYLHYPFFLNLANHVKSSISFLNDILQDFWNEEYLELYKNADINELNKLHIHPYTDIVSIKTVENNELVNHKMGAGEAMLKGQIYGGVATSLEMHERNQMGSTLVSTYKHIITFREELKLPLLYYKEKTFYNSNTVGFLENRNKIFNKLYNEPRFAKIRSYNKLIDNAKKAFDKGEISRSEYEKQIKDIEMNFNKEENSED